MKYYFVLIFTIFSNYSFANKIGNGDTDYICSDVTHIFSEIINAYCHSNVTSDIEEECDLLDKEDNQCVISQERNSVIFIDLSRTIELESNIESTPNNIEAPKMYETNDTPRELLEMYPDLLIENATASIEPFESQKPSFSIGIKCVNSIKNEWLCGFGHLGYSRTQLSNANNELSIKLKKEILKTALSAVSKL